MILQIARYLGLTTIASVRSEKMDFVRALGADHVIDRSREQPVKRVNEITRGRGVNLSLNPISGNTLATDLETLAPFGTAVIFGFLGGLPAGTFADDFAKHFQKSVAVRLSDIYTYFNSAPQAFNADLSKVFDLLARDLLHPQITELPLEAASEAHRRLESGITTGKFVLTID
jgi:NADPH2:quinone reductase